MEKNIGKLYGIISGFESIPLDQLAKIRQTVEELAGMLKDPSITQEKLELAYVTAENRLAGIKYEIQKQPTDDGKIAAFEKTMKEYDAKISIPEENVYSALLKEMNDRIASDLQQANGFGQKLTTEPTWWTDKEREDYEKAFKKNVQGLESIKSEIEEALETKNEDVAKKLYGRMKSQQDEYQTRSGYEENPARDPLSLSNYIKETAYHNSQILRDDIEMKNKEALGQPLYLSRVEEQVNELVKAAMNNGQPLSEEQMRLMRNYWKDKDTMENIQRVRNELEKALSEHAPYKKYVRPEK